MHTDVKHTKSTGIRLPKRYFTTNDEFCCQLSSGELRKTPDEFRRTIISRKMPCIRFLPSNDKKHYPNNHKKAPYKPIIGKYGANAVLFARNISNGGCEAP